MKAAIINMSNSGSTGKIMLGIAENLRNDKQEAYTFSPRFLSRSGRSPRPAVQGHRYFGFRTENLLHRLLSELTGFHGCFSFFGTLQLIHSLKKIKPDIISLHNLHNWTLNIPLLFHYIRRSGIKCVWTLHDCWAFTGQCPHFVMAGCSRWKSGCHDCPQLRVYPMSFADNTRRMWRLKKKWFTGIPGLSIVTPSRWLAELVTQSYLKDYPLKVIGNGIDLSVFRPCESNFREKYGIGKKPIILGVAFDWGKRKGLDVFIELSRRLQDKYQIVLVGTDKNTDALLPDNIISIHRSSGQQELAEIYTAADVFANPTREEVLGLVNLEALACGTPVVTFDTGGSPECIDESCGITVGCDDIDAMERALRLCCEKKPFSPQACIRRARAFDAAERYKEYTELYKELCNDE